MNKIKTWLQSTKYKNYNIKVASADASFRKYYRLTLDDESVMLMDSSLEIDSLKPFIDVTSRLSCVGVNVPVILEKNLASGFLIISDFGDIHYLNRLNENNFKELYKKAMLEIVIMQDSNIEFLPIYDKEFLHFEMDLMSEWYLQKKLNINLNKNDKKLIENTLNKISEEVLKQPQNVFVHRDFHSRNIMITKDKKVGVIDYQDAMNGAITYDLVSLLKDCYIEFKREDIENLVLEFRDMLKLNIDDKTFIKYFDFMGLQRHIKVLGIFSRLALRDNKNGYLKDIPLTLKYVIDTALRYEETKEFAEFLQKEQK
jgi:aminoglycoside/choline kinase family phosphotransferase